MRALAEASNGTAFLRIESFEKEIGYSRAVVDGEWIFASGTTGFDYVSMTISDDLQDQTEQCLRNIESALNEAGATLADVVRVTYVVPNAPGFPECFSVLRKFFGGIRPAAMMISAGHTLLSTQRRDFVLCFRRAIKISYLPTARPELCSRFALTSHSFEGARMRTMSARKREQRRTVIARRYS